MDDRKPVASFVLKLLLVSTCITGVSSGICFLDQMLTSEGECVDCPFCPGGQGMDLEEEVLRNKDGDPLECRPCNLCGRGYYNDPRDLQYACIPCPTPCIKKNRKEYIPCGGPTKGQCGACLNSEFEDRESNIDSPCRRKQETRSNYPQFKQITDVATSAEPQRKKRTHGMSPETSEGLSVEWICFIITVTGLASVCVGIYVARHMKKGGKPCCGRDPELAKEVSSKTTMISSTATTSSSLLDSTFKLQTDLSDHTDLEPDAPMLHGGSADPDPQPHRELSFPVGMMSSGPECLHGARRPFQPRHYPTFLLTANDKYIIYTSKHIFDESKINPMFREEMNVSGQVIYAEQSRHVLGKQPYNDMVIHCLQKWIEKAGRNATFDVLCKALDKHGFPAVSDKLLEMCSEHG